MALTPEQEQMEAEGIPPEESDYRQIAEQILPESPEPPVGTYSKPRLSAFLKAINDCGATGGVPPIEMEVEEVRKQPLPIEMYQGYLACRAIGEAFITAIPEATLPDMPDATSLTDDASLALATSSIQSLIGDREYKKFVRESETSEPVAEEAVAEEAVMVEEDMSSEAANELAALM
tara:strand:+ start:33 stop:563 length:531 start_codon:yes stop_codon:yes gene_type:complete